MRADTRAQLHRAVLNWYAEQGRALLWRRLPAEPYQVLVREVMLQQTQVTRVERLLPSFLERFPTLEALAAAPLSEVIRWWQGLGYNRRARLLWACARKIVQQHGGQIPSEPAVLQQLPGIGAYTAAAIATFAFGRHDVPVVDGNVRRVLERLWGEELPMRMLVQRAAEWIPHGASERWHQALMDIGALYCRKRAPRCSECPLQRWCRTAHRGVHAKPLAQKSEPQFNGIPRRLWRGRLLRLVAKAGRVPLEEAAAVLFGTPPTPQQRRWLRTVADALVQEGLLRRQAQWLALPD